MQLHSFLVYIARYWFQYCSVLAQRYAGSTPVMGYCWAGKIQCNNNAVLSSGYGGCVRIRCDQIINIWQYSKVEPCCRTGMWQTKGNHAGKLLLVHGQWRRQGLPGWARAKLRKKISKVWGKIRKLIEIWGKKIGKWNSCPPGTVRLDTALCMDKDQKNRNFSVIRPKGIIGGLQC